MPFATFAGWNFTQDAILANAPKGSGVYAIFKQGAWLYVGESGDIQARLLQHLNQPEQCIQQREPTGFLFELWPADRRVKRRNELIQELHPPCNARSIALDPATPESSTVITRATPEGSRPIEAGPPGPFDWMRRGRTADNTAGPGSSTRNAARSIRTDAQ